MRETYLIQLPAEPQQSCHWHRISDSVQNAPRLDDEHKSAAIDGVHASPQGHRQTENQGTLEEVLAELASRVGGARIIALAPSEHITLTQVSLPVRQTSRLLQAIPFALEDQLADDVDDLHFAIGSKLSDGTTPVAVVAKEKMQGWLSAFEEVGLQLDLMLPDVLALPWQADHTTLCIDQNNRCLVRDAAMRGYALPSALLAGVMPARDDLHINLLKHVAAAPLPPGYTISRSVSFENVLDVLNQYSTAQRINLLQGAFAPRRATEKWLKAAIWPAALAASWVLVGSIALAVNNQQMRTEYNALQDRAMAEFSQAFPEITRIVDMRVQAEQQLARLRSGGADDGFLKLLSQSSPALKNVSALKVEGLQFRDGALFISLTGSDLQALETLRAEFSKIASLKLDVLSAQAGTEGVQIRLKVDQA